MALEINSHTFLPLLRCIPRQQYETERCYRIGNNRNNPRFLFALDYLVASNHMCDFLSDEKKVEWRRDERENPQGCQQNGVLSGFMADCESGVARIAREI